MLGTDDDADAFALRVAACALVAAEGGMAQEPKYIPPGHVVPNSFTCLHSGPGGGQLGRQVIFASMQREGLEVYDVNTGEYAVDTAMDRYMKKHAGTWEKEVMAQARIASAHRDCDWDCPRQKSVDKKQDSK